MSRRQDKSPSGEKESQSETSRDRLGEQDLDQVAGGIETVPLPEAKPRPRRKIPPFDRGDPFDDRSR